MSSPWLSWDGSPHVDQQAGEKFDQHYVLPLPTGQHAIAKEMKQNKAARAEAEATKRAEEKSKRKAKAPTKAKKEGGKAKSKAEAPKKAMKGGESTIRSKKRTAIQDKAKVLAGLGELGPVPENAKVTRNGLYSWAYHANETISRKAGLNPEEVKVASRSKANAVVKEHYG